jgi:hypothetical protein
MQVKNECLKYLCVHYDTAKNIRGICDTLTATLKTHVRANCLV